MAKILLAEDDPIILRMYQQAFSFEEYDVDYAADGEQALEKVRTQQPDLILLDVMMPKVSGFEVLDKLKADPATKQIPIVMLTNLSDTSDAETALSKGAVKYIVKGEHTPKEIVDLVEEIIQAYTRGEVPEPKHKKDGK